MTRKWTPLIAICLGTFMLLVDVTIVNVALPDMARDLHTSFSQLQWVIDAYALVLAALMLGVGSLADGVGRLRVYLVGLVVFALGSLGSGLAPSATVLILARCVQGVGGAAMFATTIALLNTSYQGRDRGTAFGIWGAVNGAAAATGPILGGVLTAAVSWRLIFFVNLPISVLAVALSVRSIAETRERSGWSLDLGGAASFTVASAALTFALIRVASVGWGSAQTIGLLALALASTLAFLAIEGRTARPLISLALLRRRRFLVVMLAAVLLSVAAFSSLAYASLWLQSALGLGPIPAGLVFVPLSGAAFLISATIGRHLHGSPRVPIGAGMLLIGLGDLLELSLGASSGWPAILAGLTVVGVGAGLATPTLASAAMASVPHEQGGMAAGAVNTARQLGYAIGIAVLGGIFQSSIAASVRGTGRFADPTRLALALSGGDTGALRGALPANAAQHLLHSAFAQGLVDVFLAAGIAGLLAGALVLALLRGRAEHAAAPAADATETAEALAAELA